MEKKAVVVHIISKLELGGAQKVLLETAKRLDRESFQSVLITGSQGLLVEEAESLKWARTYFLPQFLREIHPLKDLLALVKIRNILAAELRRFLLPASCLLPQIIVHTHGSKAGVLGRIAARLAGIPIIVHTVHGFAFHDYQPKLVKRTVVLIERFCAKLTTTLIAVSKATREKGLREKIGDRSKYRVVYPGTVLDEFLKAEVSLKEKKEELGLDPGLPVVGTVSCFKPQKAPLDVVKVADRVLESFPDVQFVWVGDGILRGKVEGLIDRLGLRGRVHLLGWRRDVSHIVPVFDVFLLTSLWEGLPIVFAEVMAQSVPIVATSVDGIPEAVIDGANGFLAPPGDIRALADKVLLLLKDEERRRLMGARGRDTIEKFDIGRMVEEIERLYLSFAVSH